jgi:hypothetical protein
MSGDRLGREHGLRQGARPHREEGDPDGFAAREACLLILGGWQDGDQVAEQMVDEGRIERLAGLVGLQVDRTGSSAPLRLPEYVRNW